jgi:hypothetical protein
MAYNSAPFRPSSTDPDTIPVDLNNANNDFTILGQCFFNNDPTTAKAKDSDKVDGIDLTQLARVDTTPTFTGGRDTATGGKINLVKPLTTNLLSDISIDSYNSSNSSFRVSATNSKSQVSGCKLNFENLTTIHDICLIDSNVTKTISTATESELKNVLNEYNYIALPSGNTLTINLPAGVFNLTAALTLPQLGGNAISLIGAAPTVCNITGVGSISGSAGNWSVPLNLSSATGINVGDYIVIGGDLSGTGNLSWIAGIWKVTAISGNTVTIKNTARFSSVPTFTLTNGVVWKFNTVLNQTTSGENGVSLYNLREVLLRDILIVSNSGNGVGLFINNCSKVTLYRGGITNFGRNLELGNGTSKVIVDGGSFMCCGSTTYEGVKIWGCNNCIETNGYYLITNGNYSNGISIAYSNCSEICPLSCANGNNGFYGKMCTTPFSYVTAQNNVSTDIYVVNQARIVMPSSSAYSIYGSISPAVNTWGNVNSYIATY